MQPSYVRTAEGFNLIGCYSNHNKSIDALVLFFLQAQSFKLMQLYSPSQLSLQNPILLRAAQFCVGVYWLSYKLWSRRNKKLCFCNMQKPATHLL